MKILIKFDYENKTYYVYQEDNEIKYGTNEDMKNVSLEDENIIKKVIENRILLCYYYFRMEEEYEM